MFPVSVIVPYYRGARYLSQLRETLVQQAAAEVVVVVDGAEEREQVESALFDVPGVVVTWTEHSVGTAGARNRGAEIATQPWITFLDQDDRWPAGFLSDLWSSAAKTKEFAVAYDNELYEEALDGSQTSLGVSVFEKAGWNESHLTVENSVRLIKGFPMVKLLLRTEVFRAINGYRESIYAVEDFDLVWRLIADGNKIAFVSAPKGTYVVRRDSTTGRIAAGELDPALRALRSWLGIWTKLASASSMPRATRRGASLNAARTFIRISKTKLRSLLRVGSSEGSARAN